MMVIEMKKSLAGQWTGETCGETKSQQTEREGRIRFDFQFVFLKTIGQKYFFLLIFREGGKN